MVQVNSSQSCPTGSSTDVNLLGKEMMRIMKERDANGDYYSKEDALKNKENLDAFGDLAKEDFTSDNNTGLYTTVVADFVERALRPTLLAEGVIKRIRVDNKGASGIKIPVSTLATASALPDSGAVTFPNGVDYTSKTIDFTWVYAAQKITMEIIEQANVDLIQDQLFELGDAIARKIDTDIIAAIDGAITPGTNGINLGAATNVTYDSFVTGLAGHNALNAQTDMVLTNWTTWSNLMKDTDIKSALGFNSATAGTVFPMVQQLFGLKLLVSNQVGANNLYFIDSRRTGYFVEVSEVKVFNDRSSGALAQEVIAAKNYGVDIVQANSVFRLKENTA